MSSEPFVITRLCRDCVDGDCVTVCPVDCILQPREGGGLPNQLFIDPDECIHCGACEPACPWEAIYAESEVPPAFTADIALNALAASNREAFQEPVLTSSRAPSTEEVVHNRRRWEDDVAA